MNNIQVDRRGFLKTSAYSAACAGVAPGLLARKAHAQDRPNIIWIIVEDMSAHFGCYGETNIETPNVDRMAERGLKFEKAFITAPVCSPARSALITGMYQTSIGVHQHRSGRGKEKIYLPDHVKMIPKMFQEAGYYTCNANGPGKNPNRGKTDYNFEFDPAVYDGTDWSERKEGQPFFAQIQLNGGKYRHGRNWKNRVEKTLGSTTSHDQVQLPPYYPEHPDIVEDWAQYLDTVRFTDYEVGKVFERLKEEGIEDNTYVFFITDHGISHVRGKQYLYEEGIHIPFLVTGPGIQPGSVRDDLIVHIDMAATSLALAGIEVPAYLESRDLFKEDYYERPFIVSARDRCDETVDYIRGVRTEHFKYIRNYLPERPYLAPNAYKDHKKIVRVMRQLHEEGKLNEHQSLIMAEERPEEELYDLRSDPYELQNLAEKEEHLEQLVYMRGLLHAWEDITGDEGRRPEPEAMFNSDMEVYVNNIRGRGDEERAKIIEENIELMKTWARQGK